MKTNITNSIKSKFSNAVHKLLEPNIGIKRSDRWRYRDAYKFTDKQKLELFDRIVALHSDCSNELSMYFYNRRSKKRIIKARIKRGYVPKKKTAREAYEKMKNDLVHS